MIRQFDALLPGNIRLENNNQEASLTTLTKDNKYIYVIYFIYNYKHKYLFFTALLQAVRYP